MAIGTDTSLLPLGPAQLRGLTPQSLPEQRVPSEPLGERGVLNTATRNGPSAVQTTEPGDVSRTAGSDREIPGRADAQNDGRATQIDLLA